MASNAPMSIAGRSTMKAGGSVERPAARTVVGAVTIGQAPRTDVTLDIAPLFGPGIELIEAGALDGLNADGIAVLAPREGDPVLASRLCGGESVLVSERRVMPLVQQAIDRMVAQGAQAVILLCTATDPLAFTCRVPVVHPSVALAEHVAAAADGGRIAVIVPDQAQISDIGAHWERVLGSPVYLYAASPYGPSGPRLAAAEEVACTDASLVVLDCIGYSVEMAQEIERVSGKRVVVPRMVAAEAVSAALTTCAVPAASTIGCPGNLGSSANPTTTQSDDTMTSASCEASVRY